MIDRDGERGRGRRTANGAEALRQGHATVLRERTVAQRRRYADRRHPVRTIEQRDPDLIATRACAGIDEAPVLAQPRRAHRRHQRRDAGLRPVAVVLQLHQRQDVGLQRADRRQMAIELGLIVGQAARPARCGKTAAAAVAVEHIFQIEADDAQIAAHLRRARAQCGGDGRQGGELQAVAAAALIDHAFHPR